MILIFARVDNFGGKGKVFCRKKTKIFCLAERR